MAAYRNVVVAVHAGGTPGPGLALRALAATLPGAPGSYQRADLVLGNEVYPRLLSTDPALPELIEVDGSAGGAARRSRAWILRRLLGLIMGLPTVRFDWCQAAPALQTRQAYREVVQGALLWSAWPVLLTMVHSVVLPAARPSALLLDVVLVVLLAVLARSQWRPACRVTVAGYVWLGLCLGLLGVLWRAPQWSAQATEISIRVFGLVQLVAAAALLALTVEVVSRIGRGRVSRGAGLAGLALTALPLLLAALLAACLWAVLLNLLLVAGSQPVRDAFNGWQQTYGKTLGYHLASVEWAGAAFTALLGVMALAAGSHAALTRRGEMARRWFVAILVLLPLGAALLALYMILTSPYVGAPLAARAQHWGGAADLTTVYTWSALRLLPWLLVLATPVRRGLALLGETGFYLMPPDEAGASSRQTCRDRLDRVLRYLDQPGNVCGHVIAAGHGALVALDVLRDADLARPPQLTTCGSPAGALYHDLLDWPAAAGSARWRHLFRQDDPLGGPVGAEKVDTPLPPAAAAAGWSDPALAERVLQVMRSAAAEPLNTGR